MGRERSLGIGLVLVLVVVVAVAAAIVLDGGTGVAPSRDGPGAVGATAPPGETARVERVVDGDTIVVELDGRRERVRYIGVDAPELANEESGAAAECWGEEASEANERIVGRADVVLERDVSDRDRFGRLLRHVWVVQGGAWRLVAEELAAAGAVEAHVYPPDAGHDVALGQAERAARQAGRGLWGGCSSARPAASSSN